MRHAARCHDCLRLQRDRSLPRRQPVCRGTEERSDFRHGPWRSQRESTQRRHPRQLKWAGEREIPPAQSGSSHLRRMPWRTGGLLGLWLARRRPHSRRDGRSRRARLLGRRLQVYSEQWGEQVPRDRHRDILVPAPVNPKVIAAIAFRKTLLQVSVHDSLLIRYPGLLVLVGHATGHGPRILLFLGHNDRARNRIPEPVDKHDAANRFRSVRRRAGSCQRKEGDWDKGAHIAWRCNHPRLRLARLRPRSRRYRRRRWIRRLVRPGRAILRALQRPQGNAVREKLGPHHAVPDAGITPHELLGLLFRWRGKDDYAEGSLVRIQGAAGHQYNPARGQPFEVPEVFANYRCFVRGWASAKHFEARGLDAVEELLHYVWRCPSLQ